MELVKTYIDGFDEEIGGGIPKGHLVLITGTPGTMKSSIALNILYNNANASNTKSLYISLEEERDSILTAMDSLNMSENVEDTMFIADMGTFRLMHPDFDKEEKWLNTIKNYMEKMIADEGYEIVVIDSLAALYSIVNFYDKRQDLFHFFKSLKKLGSTIFLIAEVESDTEAYSTNDEGYLVDGIIKLKFFDVGETDAQLRIKCVKMRHVNHYHGNLTLMFRGDGFRATHTLTE